MSICRILTACLLCALTAGAASAEPAADPYAQLNQLYVDQHHPNAADVPGAGTQKHPWATIDFPINNNLLAAGDVLNIVNSSGDEVETYTLTSPIGGTVQAPTLRLRASGTPSAPIVIRAQWGQYRRVRIEGPGQLFGNHEGGDHIQHYIRFAGLVLHSTTPIDGAGMNAYAAPFTFVGKEGEHARGIHVEYCQLIGGGTSLFQEDNAQLVWMDMAGTFMDPVVLRHNEFSEHRSILKPQHGGAGIRSYGNSVAEVYNNLFVNVSNAYAYKSGAGTGSRFSHNVITGTNSSVLDMNNAGGSGGRVDLDVYQNLWIGPVVDDATAENRPFIYLGDSGNIDRLRVFNNTLVDTSRIFYAVGSANVLPGSIEFFNNIRVRADGSALDVTEYIPGDMAEFVSFQDYNCLHNPGIWEISTGPWSGFDMHSVSGDPAFTDPVGGDYSLQAASPCLLAGLDRGMLMGESDDAPINAGAFITADNSDSIGPQWDPQIGAEPSVGRTGIEAIAADLASLLPTGDRKDDKRILEALEKLAEASEESLWIDPERVGDDAAFNKTKDAVKKLEKVRNSDVVAFIVRLVDIAAASAQRAIEDADLAEGKPKKIKDAWKAFGKADDKIAKGKYHEAIDKYKKAWKKALEAI